MMTDVERRRVKTADTALPDMLVDYLDLLLQDATTESDVTGAAVLEAEAFEADARDICAPDKPALNPAPNPGLEATFDMAADCLQSLRSEIEATQRFVIPAPLARTETFACLQVRVGPYTLLVPVDQVRRVEQVEKFDRFAGVSLPGLDATSYLLLTDVDLPGIYVDAVEGITRIEPDDVLWRRPSTRSPWFVGTHTTSLSRVFDPIYFLQRTRIGWR
ncbi:MAG: hypothetical protein ACI9SB_001670 [Candidatus Azotimanducaceae bacterium]|jgi:hypothetical protein